MSLYEKLFKYAPSSNRTPLENFLTEALCDILERLRTVDSDAALDLLVQVFLGNRGSPAFRRTLEDASKFFWITQVRIKVGRQFGYLDLCLFVDGKPLVAIENKVAAGFTEHTLMGEGETKAISQMMLYDQWLCTKNPDGALVLLTHFTEGPEGFAERSPTANISHLFRAPVRNKCLWTTVYGWLAQWRNLVTEQDDIEIASLRKLVGEFLGFLEERKMAPISIRAGDLNVIGSWLEQDVWRKARQVLEETRNIAVPIVPLAYGKPKSFPVTYLAGQYDLLWDWTYCFEKELKWYVGWGLCGRDGLKGLDLRLSGESPYTFVLVTSEKMSIPLSKNTVRRAQSAGWGVREVGDPTPKQRWIRLVKQNSCSLLMDQDFNAQFREWVITAVKEAVSFLQDGHRQL